MFNFNKQKISAELSKDKNHVHVKIATRTTKENSVIILFAAVRQVAAYLRIPHRQLLNQLISLDKTIIKSEKQAERDAKYGKKK